MPSANAKSRLHDRFNPKPPDITDGFGLGCCLAFSGFLRHGSFSSRLSAPGAGGCAELAFEGATERRFGFVADCKTDLRHIAATFAQVLSGHMHAPERQVLHRWLSDQRRESLREN